jgi:hypothetical protein
MQDAVAPLWDKGDNTDNYIKGGGSGIYLFGMDQKESQNEDVEAIYDLVLGRKPTSREFAYYRYSTVKRDDILKKLVKGQEHKDIIDKGRKYGDLEIQIRLEQSTILKLRQSLEDRVQEIKEMKSLLDQKNKEIAVLREQKRIPFVTQTFLEGKGSIHYTNVRENEKQNSLSTSSWIDKLAEFIKRL